MVNDDILIRKGEIKMKKRKLFISCPMKGRTDENIKESMEVLHKAAEIMFNEEFDVIDSFIENNPPKTKNERIWYLGESLKKLADADAFIGIGGYYAERYPGCEIERRITQLYDIDARFIYMDDYSCFDDITKAPCTPVPGDMEEVSDSTPTHECTCEPEGCCNDGCCAIDFGE